MSRRLRANFCTHTQRASAATPAPPATPSASQRPARGHGTRGATCVRTLRLRMCVRVHRCRLYGLSSVCVLRLRMCVRVHRCRLYGLSTCVLRQSQKPRGRSLPKQSMRKDTNLPPFHVATFFSEGPPLDKGLPLRRSYELLRANFVGHCHKFHGYSLRQVRAAQLSDGTRGADYTKEYSSVAGYLKYVCARANALDVP